MNDATISTDKEFTISKINEAIKQYTLMENSILKKLNNTILFPYLLGMKYLVGSINNIPITDSPEETLPYFNMADGVKDQYGIEITENNLSDWQVYKYSIPIKTKFLTVVKFDAYLFLNLSKADVNYFFFSFYQEKILNQEITLTMLNKQESIQKIMDKVQFNNQEKDIGEVYE